MKHSMSGVTLIELMIVVVVLSIIASIAVPSYRNYILRAQRSEATAALLQIQQAQEKFFLQNNRYADSGELTTAPPNGLGLLAVTPNGKYDVAINRPTLFTYTATATPTSGGGQTADTDCQSLTIYESGKKESSPNTTVCWK